MSRVIQADLPWEYYIVRRDDGTATGNVYLGSALIYRCNLELDPEDYGYATWDELPDSYLIERTGRNFAHTLWSVLFEAQNPKERGQ